MRITGRESGGTRENLLNIIFRCGENNFDKNRIDLGITGTKDVEVFVIVLNKGVKLYRTMRRFLGRGRKKAFYKRRIKCGFRKPDEGFLFFSFYFATGMAKDCVLQWINFHYL